MKDEEPKNKSRQSNNTSGCAGVGFHVKLKKWRAYIKIESKMKHLGMFESYEEAVAARKRAEYVLGFHPNSGEDISSYNVGNSNYSKYNIQPWQIITDYGLNYWDGDIIKRVLRTKEGDSRRLDYEKIIHICKERIRQIDAGYE